MFPTPINSVHLTANHLPVYILAEIFSYCDENSDNEYPATVSAVCRCWRDAALHLPSIWQNLVLDARKMPRAEALRGKAELWITRSGTALIDVCLIIGDHTEVGLAMLSYISPVVPRLRSIEIQGEYVNQIREKETISTKDSFLESFTFSLIPERSSNAGVRPLAPPRDRITIRYVNKNEEAREVELDLNMRRLPNAKHLSSFSYLKHLRFEGPCDEDVPSSLHDLITLLSTCANVESLHVQNNSRTLPPLGCSEVDTREPSLLFHLPCLRSLELSYLTNIGCIFTHAILSKLQFLDIKGYGTSSSGNPDLDERDWRMGISLMSGLKNMLRHCTPPLQQLLMYQVHLNTVDYKWIFATFASLKTLHMNYCLMSDEIVQALQPDEDAEWFPLRSLMDLELQRCSSFSGTAIIASIASRVVAAEHGHVAELSHLKITDCGLPYKIRTELLKHRKPTSTWEL